MRLAKISGAALIALVLVFTGCENAEDIAPEAASNATANTNPTLPTDGKIIISNLRSVNSIENIKNQEEWNKPLLVGSSPIIAFDAPATIFSAEVAIGLSNETIASKRPLGSKLPDYISRHLASDTTIKLTLKPKGNIGSTCFFNVDYPLAASGQWLFTVVACDVLGRTSNPEPLLVKVVKTEETPPDPVQPDPVQPAPVPDPNALIVNFRHAIGRSTDIIGAGNRANWNPPAAKVGDDITIAFDVNTDKTLYVIKYVEYIDDQIDYIYEIYAPNIREYTKKNPIGRMGNTICMTSETYREGVMRFWLDIEFFDGTTTGVGSKPIRLTK